MKNKIIKKNKRNYIIPIFRRLGNDENKFLKVINWCIIPINKKEFLKELDNGLEIRTLVRDSKKKENA